MLAFRTREKEYCDTLKLLSLKFLILITVAFLSIEIILTIYIMLENEHLARAFAQQISSSAPGTSLLLSFIPAASLA